MPPSSSEPVSKLCCFAALFSLRWPLRWRYCSPPHAMALRWWVIRTLGAHWNVEVMASAPLGIVTKGPFRWVRHPNYAAVFVELVALPLIHTAWLTAILAAAGNTWVLRHRLRIEERVLHADPVYRATMAESLASAFQALLRRLCRPVLPAAARQRCTSYLNATHVAPVPHARGPCIRAPAVPERDAPVAAVPAHL